MIADLLNIEEEQETRKMMERIWRSRFYESVTNYNSFIKIKREEQKKYF